MYHGSEVTKKALFGKALRIKARVLPKNAQKYRVWNPDSSPHKRQSDKSYLPNQAVRARSRPLSASAPFCDPTVIGNLDRIEYWWRDAPLPWFFIAFSFYDDSTNWEGCQYSEQIYSLKFEKIWCFDKNKKTAGEKTSELRMKKKIQNEKIFMWFMHKRREIYIKKWIFMYLIGFIAQ